MAREFTIIQQVLRSIIGNSSDVANTAGSVHAKLAELRSYILSTALSTVSPVSRASSNIKASSPAEVSVTGSNVAATLKKEIIVTAPGTVRVSFELRCSHSIMPSATAYIYINGVSVAGWTKDGTITSYAVYTYDCSVKAGDRVQLFLAQQSASSCTAYARNYQLGYDLINDPVVTM